MSVSFLPKRFGRLPPLYSFALNPYNSSRFSRCPQCRVKTWRRKLPFLIHVEGAGLVVLGKTSTFCTRCQLIIVHQDELEVQLEHLFDRRSDQLAYLVLGTVERDMWRESFNTPLALEDLRAHTADFKHHLRLEMRPEDPRL